VSSSSRTSLLLAACFALLLSGCGPIHYISEGTLTKIYTEQRPLPKNHVGIFVPGVLGTVLMDGDGNVVWGGVMQGDLDVLALPVGGVTLKENRDLIVPSRLLSTLRFLGVAEMEIYQTAGRIAVEAGGYRPGNMNNPKRGEDAYSFKYDWRRDLVEAAQQLGEQIEKIKQGHNNPDLKIRLLCHSAGGLVARYYVKYGTKDVLDQDPLPPPTWAGAQHVSKIVMLGTPNSGSAGAFQRLHEGLALPLVGRLTPETIFTMPACYQLLPHKGMPLFIDGAGKPLEVDLYDAANWEKYGWSVFAPKVQAKLKKRLGERYPERLELQRRFLAKALDRAARFHEALHNGDPEEEKKRVEYVVMGATCEPTPRRVILENKKDGWRMRFKTRDKELVPGFYHYGDNTVTRGNLLGDPWRLPGVRAMFFAEAHEDLTKNVTFMDNVLHTLMEE
jgi:hypothetical protein